MKSYETIVDMVKIVKEVTDKKEITHKQNTDYNRLLGKVDKEFLKKKQATKAFELMHNAFVKENFIKAYNHSQKVMTYIRPVANDKPFNIKDRVAVIRYEHGWPDGRMEAVIRERYQSSTGVWRYVAQVVSYENDEYIDPNHTIEIRHTRDASLCY